MLFAPQKLCNSRRGVRRTFKKKSRVFLDYLKRQLDARLPAECSPQNFILRDDLLQHSLQPRNIQMSFDGDNALSDLRHAAFVNPTLTTVHLPLYEVGALACERMVERAHGKIDRVAEKLPTHLVVRESTAMAGNGAPA